MKRIMRLGSKTRHNTRPQQAEEKPDSLSRAVTIGVLVAVIPALIAYAFTFMDGLRKDELTFTNAQIEKLYGPLLALTEANDATWGFIHVKRSLFQNQELKPAQEKIVWRIWMKNVFQPLNEKMEDAIIKNSQLIVGEQMPQTFKDLIAQTEAYKAIVAGWKEDDKNDPDSFGAYTKSLFPILVYNTNIISCASETYKALKQRQEELEKTIFYFGQGHLKEGRLVCEKAAGP